MEKSLRYVDPVVEVEERFLKAIAHMRFADELRRKGREARTYQETWIAW